MNPKLAIQGGKPVRNSPFPKRMPYGEDDIKEVTEAIMSQNLFYTQGNKTTQFEEEFSRSYDIKHTIACSSGTAAVHMAVAALDLEPGSEVIVSPVTDYGSIAGIIFQGLIPVFADWKEDTFTIDPLSIENCITQKTGAILTVHLFGNPCDMDNILEIAARHRLPVIEDCAQAYFTTYKGKLCGTMGDIGCFSMQMSKHLPTGEGGAVITNNDNYAMRMGLFRDKGWENRNRWGARSYTFVGINYRMNDLTGALALSQFRKTESVVASMRSLGNLLSSLIIDIPGILPCPVTPGSEHSYWLYAFKSSMIDARDIAEILKAEGIPCGWGYTVKPIYLCTEALSKKRTFGTSGYPFSLNPDIEYREGLCPVAEKELLSIITLRFYENWTKQDIVDVADAIRKAARGVENE